MVRCRVLLGERIQGACVQISNSGNACVELGNGLLDGGGLQRGVYTADAATVEESAPRHRMQTWKTCRERGHSGWRGERAAARSGAARARAGAGPGRGVSGGSTVSAYAPSVLRACPGPSCTSGVAVRNWTGPKNTAERDVAHSELDSPHDTTNMRRTSQLARTVLRRSATRLGPPTLARTKPPKESSVSSTQPDRPSSRVHKRLASSQPVVDEQHSDQAVLAAADSPPEPDPTDPAPEKPPRRRASSLSKDSDDRPQLPPALDILWLPDSPPSAGALPPPELFEEALTNLHIALHPQTQHRAAYSSPAGPPIEPALALYCPVEGGEYVLDDTVRELARRTGAEVLVIDSVHLAAGEWGHFGKGAVVAQSAPSAR